MNTSTVRDQLLTNLKESKEYREGFVAEHIKTTIPFQLRAIRKKLRLTQKVLGLKAGMAPERITVLEDPNYSKFTLSTLLRLADALDVALIVRFAPFSELLNWASDLSSEKVAVPDFAKDEGLRIAVKQNGFEQNASILELTGAIGKNRTTDNYPITRHIPDDDVFTVKKPSPRQKVSNEAAVYNRGSVNLAIQSERF